MRAPWMSGNSAEAATPNSAPPTVAKSGSDMVSMSTNVQNMRMDANSIPTPAEAGGSRIHIEQNTAAVRNSTSGYRGEIFRPQHLARPRRSIHPRIGMLSNHAIGFPHAQREPGRTIDLPAGMRRMQTFRKLPTHAPNMKNAAGKNAGKAEFICSRVAIFRRR